MQEPPLTWRWSLYEVIPSASHADHASFTRTVDVPRVVFEYRVGFGAVIVGVLFVVVSETVVDCERPSDRPVTVIVNVPRGVGVPQFEVVIVRSDDAPPAGFGLKAAPAPAGSPVTPSVMEPGKFERVMLIVYIADLPWATDAVPTAGESA